MNKDQINALAVLWVDGDQNAFSKLYDHFVDKIYRFVFFKVPNEEAFDLTENVFVKVLENREYYAVKKGSFSTWIYTIARNTVIDFYRVSKTHLDLDEIIDLPDNTQDVELKVEGVLNSEILKSAISKLPQKYQDMIVLRFIDDMSYGEIADICEKTEVSVRVDIHRALKKLKIELKEL